MEFFGKTHDYFNRVKNAGDNPIVCELPTCLRVADEKISSSISWASTSGRFA
jgi:hypothetical protein